ncbi:LysE family translocator [Croceivirga thetidis]|uniref:LysE family transporter n=1 Tax=Croceivirga thetidis TaxID=2721623 RepID=A0ABX1GMU1_9FLAO|nr:LysE family transporter [Croceivirga thetidis]NKI31232.1 LysE family transporter [Croceivirga thetidis]
MIEDIQAAIPLGILLSFMVGPVFFVLLETGATKGFRAAMSVDVGVILADILFIVIAYFSSFQLLENLSNQPGLYVLGGTILIIYGLVIIFKKEAKKDKPKKLKGTYLGLMVKGFLLNFINIGVLVYWLIVLFVVGPLLNNEPNRLFTFFLTVILTYLAFDIIKILLAKQLRKKLTEKRVVTFKKVLGVLMIVCGIAMTLKGFVPFDVEEGIERMENRMNN